MCVPVCRLLSILNARLHLSGMCGRISRGHTEVIVFDLFLSRSNKNDDQTETEAMFTEGAVPVWNVDVCLASMHDGRSTAATSGQIYSGNGRPSHPIACVLPGEEEQGETAVSPDPLQTGVTRRRNFGFSLPAPIEIELEERHASEMPEMEEARSLEASGAVVPALSSPEPEGQRSEGTNSPSLAEEYLSDDGILSPQGGSINPKEHGALGMPVDAPRMPDMLSRWDSLPLDEREGFLTQAACASAREAPEAPQGELEAKLSAPAKMKPVQGEQEARWLNRDRKTPIAGSGVADVGISSSSHQSDDFRVYPHYVPIPTTAEATSLPFLSGEPLVALGHRLEKNAGGEAEIGSERTDQKLLFQLAIHDLSICWRLFKGRDWVERQTSEDIWVSHQGGEGQRHQRTTTRGPSSRYFAKCKDRRRERTREDTGTSSLMEGGVKPRKTELLDALLENYRDERGGYGEAQTGRHASRQPRVKLLNIPRDSGSSRPGRRTGRDTSCMLQIVLEHCGLRLDNFHPGPPSSLLSNLLFSIRNLQVSDTLTSSRPRKTLHHWRDDRRHPREFQQKMVTIRMTTRSPSDHFCPEHAPLGDEIMLKVRLLPMHLSFGQHTVDFLRSFSSQVRSTPGAHEQQTAVVDSTAGPEKETGPLFISCCDVGSFKV